MLKNTNNDDFFEDDSYRDNYEGLSGDDLFGDGGSVLDNDTTSFNQQGFNQQQFNQQGFNQQGFNQQGFEQQQYQQQQYQQQYQQGMQQQYQQQYQQTQQAPQEQGVVKNIANKILENGGIKLTSTHAGIALIILAVIVVLIIFGIHGLMSRPKTQRTQSQTQTTVTQKATSSKSNTSSVETLNLIVVGDDVPVDYTSMKLSSTGLVTNKQTFVVDNQLVYCLDISMTVGSGTRTIHHFCNRTIFTAIDTGTVVNITYQQVDENNIAVYDISTTN